MIRLIDYFTHLQLAQLVQRHCIDTLSTQFVAFCVRFKICQCHSRDLFVVTPLCNAGDLLQQVTPNHGVEEPLLQRWLRQILIALAYIHSKVRVCGGRREFSGLTCVRITGYEDGERCGGFEE